MPATFVALAANWAALQGGAPLRALAGPALLLGCHALWAKADLMLFRPAPKVPSPRPS